MTDDLLSKKIVSWSHLEMASPRLVSCAGPPSDILIICARDYIEWDDTKNKPDLHFFEFLTSHHDHHTTHPEEQIQHEIFQNVSCISNWTHFLLFLVLPLLLLLLLWWVTSFIFEKHRELQHACTSLHSWIIRKDIKWQTSYYTQIITYRIKMLSLKEYAQVHCW